MTMSNDFTGVLDVSHRAGGAWTDAYEYRSVQQYSNDCEVPATRVSRSFLSIFVAWR